MGSPLNSDLMFPGFCRHVQPQRRFECCCSRFEAVSVLRSVRLFAGLPVNAVAVLAAAIQRGHLSWPFPGSSGMGTKDMAKMTPFRRLPSLEDAHSSSVLV